MSNELKEELHNEIYEVLADNVDLNDKDLIANRSTIIERLEYALVLINGIKEL